MTEKRNKSLHGKLRYHQSACAVETLLGDISVAKSFGVSAGHQLCFKSTAWSIPSYISAGKSLTFAFYAFVMDSLRRLDRPSQTR